MATKAADANPEEKQVIKEMPRPRLIKLIIKNFRCIGSSPVSIDLNDIVVLVGPNNVGKSSILRAYELAMSEGSKKGELKEDDFPNNNIDTEEYPEIELHTIVYDHRVGKHWLAETAIPGEFLVKEKWTWKSVGKPNRQGYDVEAGNWSADRRPFGPATIANTRRPEPHRVDAFSNPEEQATEIKDLLMAAITEKVKQLQAAEGNNDYNETISKIRELQERIVGETKDQIDSANDSLSSLIDQVFPNYQISFSANPDTNYNTNLFKWTSNLLMGPEGGFKSTIDRQGSGARRTLLWAALKYISEIKRPIKLDEFPDRPHILLIDEPEICLHPNAIREACKVMYELPLAGNWQVMVTTHSPIFIDFSRDNTTIIKVERVNGLIEGTTVFRPDRVNLGNDDRINLQLLNLCDPYVSEFMFGGKVIVVEGDTEYTAFNYIRARCPLEYRNVHIIRARGKATIVSMIKILNHFGSSYSILHDSDSPVSSNGTRNPAWTMNSKILETLNSKSDKKRSRLLASIPNFEEAYFQTSITKDKPYNALTVLKHDQGKFNIVKSLLDCLLDHNKEVPTGCIEWSTTDHLEDAYRLTLNK